MSAASSRSAPPIFASIRAAPFLPPSRNPVSRSALTMHGSFASLKNHAFVKFESDLERRVLMLLEFAPAVAQFSHQPPRMQIRVNGRTRRYTPDFAVKWRSGVPWIIEVKPSDIAAEPEWQERFQAAREASRERGYRFVVVTERHACRPGMADVASWLEQRRRRRIESLGDSALFLNSLAVDASLEALLHLSVALDSRQRVVAAEAARLLGGGAVGAAHLDSLLCARHVVASLDKPVSSTTLIHAYTEADDECLFL